MPLPIKTKERIYRDMDIAQRLYLQRQAIYKNNGISTNKSVLSSTFTADSDIDKYIITMIETNDKRRLLLDKSEYNSILDTFAIDAHKRIEKELESICKEFNK